MGFTGATLSKLYRKICVGKFSFILEDWKCLSDHAKELIFGLLVVSPEERLSAAEALEHEWFGTDEESLANSSLQHTCDKLKEYNKLKKFKAAVRAVMISNSLRRKKNLLGIPSVLIINKDEKDNT